MGVRSTYTIHIDPKTDAITTAWIGPDQGTESPTWGPAKTENATMMNSRGQLGLAVLPGRQPLELPRQDRRPRPAATRAPRSGIPNTVGGGADGQTGGYFDCRGDDRQRLAVQHRPHHDPRAEAGEHLVRPAGRLLRLPDQRQRRSASTPPPTPPPAPAIYRRCPWIIGGSQAPIDGGIYRKPAGDKPDAWPSYWDGRWFMIDFANTNATRHALLMDPATQFKGGQPVAVDSLYGIVTTDADRRRAPGVHGLRFRRRALRRLLRRRLLRVQQRQHGHLALRLHGRPGHPGPDPKAIVPETGSVVQFNIGKSGGVSYTWDFGDGTPEGDDDRQASCPHTYDSRRHQDRDADGELRRRRHREQDRHRRRRADAAVHQRRRRTSARRADRARAHARRRRRRSARSRRRSTRDYTASTTATRAGHQRRRAR